jgi:hypothetical protein
VVARGRWGKLAAKADKITTWTQSEAGEKLLSGFCDSQNRCLYIFEAEGMVTGSSMPPVVSKLKKTLIFSKEEDPDNESISLDVQPPTRFSLATMLVHSSDWPRFALVGWWCTVSSGK